LLAGLRGRAGGMVVFPLWPVRAGQPAKRIIVHARKGSAAPLVLSPGLVLHEPGGGFTAAADAVLRGSALEL
jgi:tRNA1(Val) A37 N6-methylase TrmN6